MLCHCEGTHLEKIDDVRDEMISNIGLGDFSNRLGRLLLNMRETWCF